jgi:2'-5' RNA ligase
MRLFIGIPLSPAVISELATLTARLESKAGSLRWTGPESWHITLEFLGGLGIFDRAGVFFAGVASTPELVSLQQRVTAATSHCGFVPETRPFHPHITLARAKGQGRCDPLRALEDRSERRHTFTRFLAQEFLLYESHLSPAGSRYEIRARFPFASGSPRQRPA